MTIPEIYSLIHSEQYNFLWSNEHLGLSNMIIVLGGSYANGTNVDTSDIDIRGCALNQKCELIGLANPEWAIRMHPDTTIYSFTKLVHLMCECNPTVSEMFGCRPEHYLYLSDEGRELLSHSDLFLSKRVVKTFGEYARTQLRRLENAIARDSLAQAQREEHVRQSMESAVSSFKSRYAEFDKGAIHLYTDDSERDDLDKEIYVDVNLTRYPARTFKSILNDLKGVIESYDKLNGRNRKKDEQHLDKHAMHLIRLYMMCLDILEKKQVITYREAEHDLLMSIRNGAFRNPDGTYRQEFFDMVTDYETRVEYAKNNTDLPEHPNMKRIEEFVMSINERVIQNEIGQS